MSESDGASSLGTEDTQSEPTLEFQPDEVPRSRTIAQLVLAVDGRNPTGPPIRWSLNSVRKVLIGRASDGRVSSARVGDALRIWLHDSWISREHLELKSRHGVWHFRDLDSRNGTFVSGDRQQSGLLRVGSCIEVGNVILLLGSIPAGDCPGMDQGVETPLARFGPLSTFNTTMADTLTALAATAGDSIPVLLEGESGTGKEVTAHALHEASARKGPLIPVNCGALPPHLLEAELFGFKRGAFSGAVSDKRGLIACANKGTLLLDEIAELPMPSQAALLRVLQDGEIRQLGDTSSCRVDARIVAATHQNLPDRVAAGEFRHDLYARLSALRVELPPLRDRREDMGFILRGVIDEIAGDTAPEIGIKRPALRALFAHDFPLNVRELKNALRTALAFSPDRMIALAHLPEELRATGEIAGKDRALREELVHHLSTTRGNVSTVAKEMGKARAQIRRWCDRLGVRIDDYRAG